MGLYFPFRSSLPDDNDWASVGELCIIEQWRYLETLHTKLHLKFEVPQHSFGVYASNRRV